MYTANTGKWPPQFTGQLKAHRKPATQFVPCAHPPPLPSAEGLPLKKSMPDPSPARALPFLPWCPLLTWCAEGVRPNNPRLRLSCQGRTSQVGRGRGAALTFFIKPHHLTAFPTLFSRLLYVDTCRGEAKWRVKRGGDASGEPRHSSSTSTSPSRAPAPVRQQHPSPARRRIPGWGGAGPPGAARGRGRGRLGRACAALRCGDPAGGRARRCPYCAGGRRRARAGGRPRGPRRPRAGPGTPRGWARAAPGPPWRRSGSCLLVAFPRFLRQRRAGERGTGFENAARHPRDVPPPTRG